MVTCVNCGKKVPERSTLPVDGGRACAHLDDYGSGELAVECEGQRMLHHPIAARLEEGQWTRYRGKARRITRWGGFAPHTMLAFDDDMVVAWPLMTDRFELVDPEEASR